MSLTQGALLTICQGGEVVNPNIQVSSLHKRDLNEKESKVLNDFADGKNIFSEIKHWGKNYDFILLVKLTKLTNKISAFSSFQLSKVCCFEIQF